MPWIISSHFNYTRNGTRKHLDAVFSDHLFSDEEAATAAWTFANRTWSAFSFPDRDTLPCDIQFSVQEVDGSPESIAKAIQEHKC